MNEKNKNNGKTNTRYFADLAVKNLVGKQRLDFALFRTDIDDRTVSQIVEESGFNFNHPNIDKLVNQIMRTFTLSELIQFIEGIKSIDVVEIKIVTAEYHVSDPIIPQKGHICLRVDTLNKQFDFSTLEGYSVPFKVMGYYYQN